MFIHDGDLQYYVAIQSVVGQELGKIKVVALLTGGIGDDSEDLIDAFERSIGFFRDRNREVMTLSLREFLPFAFVALNLR